MYIVITNQGRTCTVNGRSPGRVGKQRDLGVYMNRCLNVASQVHSVVNKAIDKLSFIGKGVDYKRWSSMMQQYKSLVRPYLDYCVEFWLSSSTKDVITLERVQKGLTRMLDTRNCRY